MMSLPQNTAPPFSGVVYPYVAPVQGPTNNITTSTHSTVPVLQPMFTANGPASFRGPVPQWATQRSPELTGLSDTMSELAISDCAQPPPSKIRRRNAITIQDPDPTIFQFHNGGGSPMAHQPSAFESSFLLQRVEELQTRLSGSKLEDMSGSNDTPNFDKDFRNISPPSPDPYGEEYQEFLGLVKRKVPTKSHAQKEIDKISLHSDLTSFKPRTDFDLPESLLRRYRSNRCNALVLYQPPIDLIAQLQEKDNDNDANEETTEMSETEMSE